MKKLGGWAGLGCAALFLAAPLEAQVAPGERYVLELELRRFRPDLVSDLEIASGGVAATPVDPVADLGLGDEQTLELRASLRLLGRLKARGSRMGFDYAGTATTERPLGFAGAGLEPGTVVESALELRHWTAGAEIDLLSGRDGFLAVVAELSRLEASPRVSTAATGLVEPETLRVELPVLGLRARAYLTPQLAVTAEATGMRREGEGVLTDLDASATYNLLRHNLALAVGYRNFYGKIESEGTRATFRLRGTYVALVFRF